MADLVADLISENVSQRKEDSEHVLLGVGGGYGSGKDALVDFLVADWDYHRTFMSQPLLDAALLLDPLIRIDQPVRLDGAHIFGRSQIVPFTVLVRLVGYTVAKEQPMVRTFLQKLGTEVGRQMIDPNVWVDALTRQITTLRTGAQSRIAVTGIRFPNELEMIRSLGGTTVWIEREVERAAGSTHASETSLSSADFDFMILNDGTLEDLRATAGVFHTDLMDMARSA